MVHTPHCDDGDLPHHIPEVQACREHAGLPGSDAVLRRLVGGFVTTELLTPDAEHRGVAVETILCSRLHPAT